MKKHANEILDKTLKDIEKFIHNQKPMKFQNNFKKKQLQFLKANVKKTKVPFKVGLRKLEAKKKRKQVNIRKKKELGL